MREATQTSKALQFFKGFKNIIGAGLLLLSVGLLLELIAIIVRNWISFPVPLTIAFRIILTIPCILISVLGAIWFNFSLNLVKIHFLGGENPLVTHGPYSYVRHPLYAALLIGLPPLLIIWYADLLFIIPWLLVFIISHYLVILEERVLIDTFGDDYTNYKKYVPALIPYKGNGGRRYREQCDNIASEAQQ
jgi:protein-S-isoprenylcysteine O-methyltransferase Ste14